MARDTKLGQEEITRDIPNVGEEALKNLDEAGIVYIGAEVNPGDILVGKVTPKGESPMTPEEKLLRAIFGEKASDVRDTSLKLPPGVTGTVVDVRVFSRRGVDKDERAMAIERAEIERLAKDRDDEKAIQERSFLNRLREKLLGRKATGGFKGIKAGTLIDEDVLNEHPRGAWRHIGVQDDAVMAEIETLKREFDAAVGRLQARFDSKVEKLQRGDELPPGVMKMVKVFIAVKRKLQPGDKMAGRHGNKGVVSRVVPVEDMPFLDDGTSVDLVLNPLGVPAAMNVGQILETHLGWACHTLGAQIGELVEEYRRTGARRDDLLERLRDVYGEEEFRDQIANLDTDQLMEMADNLKKGVPIATPVFDGARMSDIEGMLVQGRAGYLRSGGAGRWPHRRAVRAQGDGRLHLHAEAAPPGGRQDPRAFHRALLAGHPAAAGRQGAVRRPALRRDGGLGARGVWRRVYTAGDADGEVGRRVRPDQGLRGDRARAGQLRGRRAGELQRAGEGAEVVGAERRSGQPRGLINTHRHRAIAVIPARAGTQALGPRLRGR